MDKKLAVSLNQERAEMLLEGLNALPQTAKTKMAYQRLIKDIELVKTYCLRITKNEKILKDLKK